VYLQFLIILQPYYKYSILYKCSALHAHTHLRALALRITQCDLQTNRNLHVPKHILLVLCSQARWISICI